MANNNSNQFTYSSRLDMVRNPNFQVLDPHERQLIYAGLLEPDCYYVRTIGSVDHVIKIWSNTFGGRPNLKGISGFRYLEILDCASNGLDSLPEELGANIHLSELHIPESKIRWLPASLFSLPNFKLFVSYTNTLHTIPWFVCRPLRSLPPVKWELFPGDAEDWEVEQDRILLLDSYRDFIRFNEFPFTGESAVIWSKVIDYFHQSPETHRRDFNAWPKTLPFQNHYTLNNLLAISLFQIMTPLFENRLPVIIDKIKQNTPLDPLDWTHPDFPAWNNILELTCQKYPTATAGAVLSKLHEYSTIAIASHQILL